MSRNTIPTMYGTDEDGAEFEQTLPWRWEICPRCEGHGTTTAHVECDGGGFTASEWAEQDEDFREDYIAGRYDRPCPHCEGGKVKVADRDRMPPEQVEQYDAQLQADADCEAIHRLERMMGA